MTALQTTSVGSLPKPEYLLKARAQGAKGDLKRGELRRLE